MIEKAATEFDKELQIEEDATLVMRLSTSVHFKGKKKKKRGLDTTCLERIRNASPRMQGRRKRKMPQKRKKERERKVAAASHQLLRLRNTRARRRWLRPHPKWPRAKRK